MIKRPLLLLIILLTLTFSAEAQVSGAGFFLDYIYAKIESLPGTDSSELNAFQPPTSNQITNWNNAITHILNEEYSTAHQELLNLGYRLVSYYDIMSGSTFLIVEKQQNSSNHWGIYVFNSQPSRSRLIMQAPHPKYDTNTGSQATYVFQKLSARALCISGTHRCNSTSSSSCSGTTGACGSNGAFRISDNAHNENTVFQSTSEILHNTISQAKFVQLHGFDKKSSDPYVIMSNGSTTYPFGQVDYLTEIRDELLIEDNTLTFKIAHIDNWARLIATTNTQGRFINLSMDPCSTGTFLNMGTFIHLEQEKSKLRANETMFDKMRNALSRVFDEDPVISNTLIINEILADPASGIAGDANGDGTRDPIEDEFIEFVNNGDQPLDISGYKIYDTNSSLRLRHIFPSETIIPAYEALVIFGGGNPTGLFGGSIVQTASTSDLGLTNTGDKIIVTNNANIVVLTQSYGSEANDNQSITRSPDITGSASPLSKHSQQSSGVLFSPGTKINGLAIDLTCQTVDSNDFSSSWGMWNDGGYHSRRMTDTDYASSGRTAIRLRYNNDESVMTTDAIDLSLYVSMDISFSYKTRDMDNNQNPADRFYLEVSADGSNNYQELGMWLKDGRNNDQEYTETVSLSNVSYSSTTKFRFRCSTNSTSNRVYIDDVTISGCKKRSNSNSRLAQTKEADKPLIPEVDNTTDDLVMYPNPASDQIAFSTAEYLGKKASFKIFTLQGATLIKKEVQELGSRVEIEIAGLETGIYMVVIDIEKRPLTYQRLIIDK